MALIQCPECQKEISDKSKVCIHCGYPLDFSEEINTQKTTTTVDKIVAPTIKTKRNKKINKKVILTFFIAVLLIGGIIFYKPALYNIAMNKMEAENFETASTFFETLGDYADSNYYYEECQRHIYADYDFLNALEESILKRREQNDSITDYKTLTKTELAYLEEFENKEFYDNNLKAYAKSYIKGLNTQKEALSLKHIDYTIKWRAGQIHRYSVLNSLYEKYGFLKDDKEFVATYINEVETLKKELIAYQRIDQDIQEQIYDIDSISVASKNAKVPLTNNTNYKYDLKVVIIYYDKDGKTLDEDYNYEYDVVQNEKITVKVPCPNSWKTCRIYWDLENVRIK